MEVAIHFRFNWQTIESVWFNSITNSSNNEWLSRWMDTRGLGGEKHLKKFTLDPFIIASNDFITSLYQATFSRYI